MLGNLESMKNIVMTHPVTKHQFLLDFANGKLTRRQVIIWFEQQFYFSISLPSAFAALYARVPDKFWQTKQSLVSLLEVEAWGTNHSAAHSNYFKEVASFLGIDLEKLTAHEPKQYTKEYVDARFDLCLNPQHKIASGLASVALGNEFLNLTIFSAYRKGLHNIPGLEECPVGYFEAHLRDEEADFQVFQSLFDVVAQDEADIEDAKQCLVDLLDKRVVFFNMLYQDLLS